MATNSTRVTISLPKRLLAEIDADATAKEIPRSQAIRERLQESRNAHAKPKPKP